MSVESQVLRVQDSGLLECQHGTARPHRSSACERLSGGCLGACLRSVPVPLVGFQHEAEGTKAGFDFGKQNAQKGKEGPLSPTSAGSRSLLETETWHAHGNWTRVKTPSGLLMPDGSCCTGLQSCETAEQHHVLPQGMGQALGPGL